MVHGGLWHREGEKERIWKKKETSRTGLKRREEIGKKRDRAGGKKKGMKRDRAGGQVRKEKRKKKGKRIKGKENGFRLVENKINSDKIDKKPKKFRKNSRSFGNSNKTI